MILQNLSMQCPHYDIYQYHMTSKLIRDKLYARLPKVLVELILDFASQWKEQWQEVSKGLNMLCPEYATFEEHHTIMYDFKRDYHISRTAFVTYRD